MERAIQLIDRALRIEPDNGAFLDSKGWWYYTMEKYEQAREFIERALATGMQDVLHALILPCATGLLSFIVSSLVVLYAFIDMMINRSR